MNKSDLKYKLLNEKKQSQKIIAILVIITAVLMAFIFAFLFEFLKFKKLNESFVEILDFKNLEDWNVFKAKFGKVYENSDSERVHYLNFLENRKAIRAHNQKYSEGHVSYFKGINQYSDMTYDEMRKYTLGFKYNKNFNVSRYASVYKSVLRALPDSVDWRSKGVVTPVKDQKTCGSCWAFSTTGVLEGQHALATRKLVSLSEQQLIDCSKPEGNYGCGGGWPFDAFIYIIRVSQGLDTESSYPYAGVDEDCAFDPSNIGANATAFVVLTPGDENILKEAVANVGPISVTIEANENFQSYGGGVYDDPECHSDIDHMTHAVLIVGYGTDSETGKDYWLVKNSWNTSWGEEGYIKMVRNKKNQCAIATLASYMTVKPMLK